MLRLASIEHNNSKRHRLYCVWNGGTNVFFDEKKTELIQFVLDNKITCLDISRMHVEGLARRDGATFLKEIKIRTGGSAVPYLTRKTIEQSVTRNLYVRYATSETGAISMANPGEHDIDECSGRPLPGVEVIITDFSGTRLPMGDTGEIGIKASGMVSGYFDNEAQTASRFRDGWFYPGDLGYIREDGCLVVQGRKDEMITMNGLNIFPKEIEAVLESHPDVAFAAAFPIPSRIHGDIPVAVIELRSSRGVQPEDVTKWANQFLGLKTPKKIIACQKMPRNSQGKILKSELIQLFRKH